MNDTPFKKVTPSPCIGICTLNDTDICIGCFRHLNEIKKWSLSSEKEKETMIRQSSLRKKDQ
jgi:predicted Fe-S protein YdhL (DUF1289 family)